MPKRRKPIVGLEIESGAVHVASVETAGALRVHDYVTVPLEPGVVREGEVVDPQALGAVLGALFAEHGGLPKRVRVGLANQKIVVRTLDLPPISDEKEIAAAVRFQAADELPMPIDGTVIDFQSLGLVETADGPRTRVVLVAARRDMVERVLAALQVAGLRAEGIDLSAFAMVRALSTGTAEEEGTGVLYLSIGASTNLAVGQGRICRFTRVVGSGFVALHEELAARRGLTLAEVEPIFAAVGLTDADDDPGIDPMLATDARRILEEGIRRIAADVRTTVGYHAMETGTRIETCVLCGPGVLIPGFVEALQSELGVPVVAGRVATGSKGVGAHAAVAAGLAVEEAVA